METAQAGTSSCAIIPIAFIREIMIAAMKLLYHIILIIGIANYHLHCRPEWVMLHTRFGSADPKEWETQNVLRFQCRILRNTLAASREQELRGVAGCSGSVP